jgi:hypothetical protein
LKRGLIGGPHLSAGGREEERRWAGRCLLGRFKSCGPLREKEKGEKERRWAAGKLGQAERGRERGREGLGFGIFLFFQILFKQLFKPLSKSNLLHFFTTLFTNYFKDF